MKFGTRLFLGIGIVILDIITIGIPLAAFVIGYVIIFRPAWFQYYVNKVYSDVDD